MKVLSATLVFVIPKVHRNYLRVIPLFALLVWSALIDATCRCERCKDILVARPRTKDKEFPRGGSTSNVASMKRVNSPSADSVSSFKDARMRKACGLYLWNAPSALLSIWCNHLARDNVFEGRGGKKVSHAPELLH
jgi:hypothetical protein